MTSDLNDSSRFVEFLKRLTYDSYMVGAGLVEEARTADIRKSYSDIYETHKVLAEVKNMSAANSPQERRRARLRLLERGGNYLATGKQEVKDEIETLMIRGFVELDGRKIAFRMIPSILRNSPESQFRIRLGNASLQKVKELQPKIQERWKSIYGLAIGLGYESYAELYAHWKGLELNHLSDLAQKTLSATEKNYFDQLEVYALKCLGQKRDELSFFDLPWIFRGAKWDNAFRADRLAEMLLTTARCLGIELGSTGIQFDLEPRSRKSSRAFCAAVSVPEEVYLVAKPSGGHRDYEAAFHELGHALHFSFTDPTLPWELKYVSDDSVAETYAYLLASLLRSREFLVEHFSVTSDDATEFVAYANFIETYMIRSYCAKTLHEVELHRSGDPQLSADLYSIRMSEALGVKVPGELGLFEMDDGFYALQYLSAWFLEALFRARLVELFGRCWYNSADAGSLLRSFWFRGSTDTAESLATHLGERSIPHEPLIASLSP